MDPRTQRMADVLVKYSVGVKAGDWVGVQCPVAGVPLADALTRSILRAGGHPSVLLASENLQESFLQEANEDQLTFVAPHARTAVEQMDKLINVLAPTNTRALSGIYPSQLAIAARGGKELEEIFE